MNVAPFIDHTVLKPTTILQEVEKACTEALEFHFAAVCIPPHYVQNAAVLLQGSTVRVATVIGFPFGYTSASVKVLEGKEAIDNGANEIDLVMNIAALKNGDLPYLEKEIAAVLEVVREGGAAIKVIIESGILSREEIIACCAICDRLKVDFVKTSTGYAEKGATLEAVQLMRQHLSSGIRIKASGGIRTYDFALQLIQAGATRLGCSASIAIVKGSTEAVAKEY